MRGMFSASHALARAANSTTDSVVAGAVVVSVILDFIQRVEANLLMRNYAGFLGWVDGVFGDYSRGYLEDRERRGRRPPPFVRGAT